MVVRTIRLEDLLYNHHQHRQQPHHPSMSPRRRAGTDDGPAINETRTLNLPDRIAETRDNMKTLIGRQRSILKSLKLTLDLHIDLQE